MGDDLVSQIERGAKEEIEIEDEMPKGYFNTGNVMLNLAMTEKWDCGFGRGKVSNLIGGSFIGKTLQVKTCMAEIAHNPDLIEYDIIDDDVEHGTGFDIAKMFGQKTADRIKAPRYDDEEIPIYSDTVEDFIDNLYIRLKKKVPFLYALDTYDELTDKSEQKLVEDNIKIREKNREKVEGKESKEKDTYGQEKNREFNRALRLCKSKLMETQSSLIVVSQVRDNLNAPRFGNKLSKIRRNGGYALKHCSWHEIWLVPIEMIKRGPEGRVREVGAWVEAIITKNRTTGKMRSVEFPIYYDYGVDNIEACIDFLVTSKFWKKNSKGVLSASRPFDFDLKWPAESGTVGRHEMIKAVEDKNLEIRLYETAQKAWLEIEESLKIDRKSKYND